MAIVAGEPPEKAPGQDNPLFRYQEWERNGVMPPGFPPEPPTTDQQPDGN